MDSDGRPPIGDMTPPGGASGDAYAGLRRGSSLRRVPETPPSVPLLRRRLSSNLSEDRKVRFDEHSRAAADADPVPVPSMATPHREVVSVVSDTASDRGSSGSVTSLGGRRKSLATRAFEQMQRNQAIEYERDLEIGRMQREAEGLLSVVERTESLVGMTGMSAFGLNKFKDQCRAAFATRKAASRMMRGLKVRRSKKNADSGAADDGSRDARTHRLAFTNRTVLRNGPVGPRFQQAKASALSGNAAAWLSRRPSTAGGARPQDPPLEAVSSHLRFAATRQRKRPASAPPSRRPAGPPPASATGNDDLPTSPCSVLTLTSPGCSSRGGDARSPSTLAAPHPATGTPATLTVSPRTTPALTAWDNRRRTQAADPTQRAMVSVMPDSLAVLTTPVDWRQLLSEQTEVHEKLDSSDVKYRRMLDKYESYQRLIQRRLNRLLRIGEVGSDDEDEAQSSVLSTV
eukprot:TRINITY_DN10188_c0_g1_i1.p1 TRINITY_DN10188_c0_g1~~TRINITY_DN10188_c0_g1_i1.p1  ORF type:complete len:459 (+),score=116.61 TRINITY_DN10188_c0_g1_i1:57-1433(+)